MSKTGASLICSVCVYQQLDSHFFTASTTVEAVGVVPNTQTESPDTVSLPIGLGVPFGIITLVAIIAGVAMICRKKRRR